MKRLVFSGYPCPAAPWRKLMPTSGETLVITFADALDAVGKPDFKALGAFAAREIEHVRPDSIICHDYSKNAEQVRKYIGDFEGRA